LVEHVLEALRPLRAHPTVVVCGHGGAAVRRALEGRDVLFADQMEQKGTGHAVQCALPAVGGFRGDLLVLCGDTPLLTAEILAELVAAHRAAARALTVLSADLDRPGGLGRIVRGADGSLRAIREARDAPPEVLAIREINTGVLVADADLLPGALARVKPDNAQREYYLTDVPGILLRDGRAVAVHKSPDPGAALGVNDPCELAEATRALRRRILDRLLAAGVRIEDPGTTVVDAGVEVGEGTLLKPFTLLERDVRIGARCTVGPFAHLREGAVVREGAAVGAFARVPAREEPHG
ncbi:MAG: NTP transferase domain-containing protein, partial [Planctomycetota bacterium]